MRAIWKGAVSFGLVNVPVRLYAATGTKDVSFHQVHAADGGRIRYQRTCSVDGEPVAYGDIAKGYETEDGDLVVLTDTDLASLPLTTGREIEVVEFVPEDQVDPILFDRAYYLEPEKTAAKPYALLREALTTTARVAVVKVALRQRETLAVLRVRGDVICLQTVLWPDEVREPEFSVLDAEIALKPAELAMAASLVESLAADFDPTQFADGYREAVRALVEEKIASGEVRRAPAVAPDDDGGGEVVDLLSALQRSVERAKARRGESGADSADAAAAAPVPSRSTTRQRGAPTKRAAAAAAPADAPEPAEAPKRKRTTKTPKSA